MEHKISRRKLLGILAGFGLGSLLPGCVTETVEKTRTYGFVGKEGKLEVNTDPLNHFYWYKSREEGERDLLDLARESFLEDAFLFIEEQKLWLESGESETPFGTVSNTYSYCIGKDVTRYHIHPMVSFFEILRTYANTGLDDKELFGVLPRVRSYPSLNDLFFYDSKDPFEKFKQESELSREFKQYRLGVIDHIGVMDYGGFFRFLDRVSREKDGRDVFISLKESYMVATGLYYTFFDNSFIKEFMSRLPEEANFKTTERDDFNMTYKDFRVRLDQFRYSKVYKRLVLDPHLVNAVDEGRKLGRDKMIEDFRTYLDQNIGSFVK